MEEILASIRKIIADDSLGTKKDEVTKKPAAKKAAPPEPEPEPVDIDEDAEILDLAKVATVASRPQEVEVEDLPATDPQGTMDEIEPVDISIKAELPEPVEVAIMPEPTPVVAPAQAPSISPAAPQAPAPMASVAALEERIMSENTKSLVSQAFQTLSRHTAMPAMGRSLEDVVVELLRPMLRDWIDSHLPAIVEKHVRAEIERVARGG
jgi:hypothetical protein